MIIVSSFDLAEDVIVCHPSQLDHVHAVFDVNENITLDMSAFGPLTEKPSSFAVIGNQFASVEGA
jgi:hypothetical protein